MEVNVYEITSPDSQPVMYVGYVDDDDDPLAAEQVIIKKLLKQARKNKTSIHSIVITVNDEYTYVTLCGTEKR